MEEKIKLFKEWYYREDFSINLDKDKSWIKIPLKIGTSLYYKVKNSKKFKSLYSKLHGGLYFHNYYEK